jgi:IS4 transposase
VEQLGVLAMLMVTDSAKRLKRFLSTLPLSEFASAMALRIVLSFVMRRGRMSCSQAAVAVLSQPIDRSQVTRFLARIRWKQVDFNAPARKRLLMLEQRRGPFVFVIDATLVGQAGQKTENTYSTGDKSRGRRTGKRCHKYKHVRRSCHSFTFGLLITPSGHRIPMQIPHYTKEYCQSHGVTHRTTAEAAADMIDALETPRGAEVYVIGDTAYDAAVVQAACARKGYLWVFPANPERVYEGPQGQRPKVRDRLKKLSPVSPQKLRMRPSEGQFAEHRRVSRWRVGPKIKPREYRVYQETTELRSVGRVKLVFSTTKENLHEAKPSELKILMTNAVHLSVRTVVDLYSCRWQIELFFKEIKSRLGFDQYRLREFEAVRGWVELALTTVLLLETWRAEQLAKRQLSEQEKEWWRVQRLHGLCEALIRETQANELQFFRERLQTKGGAAKLQRLLQNGSPKELKRAG